MSETQATTATITVASSSSTNQIILPQNRLLSVKVNDNNYLIWKQQVFTIVCGYGLGGFLTGKTPPPPEYITNNQSQQSQPNPDYTIWKRQDQLLASWILSSLTHLNSVVVKANVVAVSVNYRLAPDHPLPIGYQDSWRALKWVFSHLKGKGTEPWIKNYVDFGHVHVGGDSAGANIAHNMAIWAGLDKTGSVFLNGLFLNCPHFWGKKPIANEGSNIIVKNLMESIWVHAYPKSTGLDDPSLNPGLDPNLSRLGCKKVLVYLAGNDILRVRGWNYKRALRKSKWKGVVKVVQAQGEEHDFGLRFSNTPYAIRMVKNIAAFRNQGIV